MLLTNGCSDEEIWENEQETVVLRNAALRDYQADSDRAVQVQPQKIYMKLIKCKLMGTNLCLCR